MLMEPQIQWVTASPLWNRMARTGDDVEHRTFRQPALLRFATDTFMDDLHSLLSSDPGHLSDCIAQPETWRSPLPPLEHAPEIPGFVPTRVRRQIATQRAIAAADSVLPQYDETKHLPLKLYQAAHQRFYMVTANLVCRIPGLPDRTLDLPEQESVHIVVRRVQPIKDTTVLDPKNWNEFALIVNGSNHQWQAAAADALNVNEEKTPMFPLVYDEPDRKRRLFGALVPTGKRETYLGAGQANPSTATSSSTNNPSQTTDPRALALLTDVIEPWNRLLDLAANAKTIIATDLYSYNNPMNGIPKPTEEPPSNTHTREHLTNTVQVQSWLMLIDFANYLAKYLPDVWRLLNGQSTGITATVPMTALLGTLTGAVYNSTGFTKSLADALVYIKADNTREQAIEDLVEPYLVKQPIFIDFPFLLAHVDGTSSLLDSSNIGDLEKSIIAALPEQMPVQVPPAPTASQPIFDLNRPSWFVIRCVFERPNCGPLTSTLLSESTQPFQLAAYFDPDAPARPIRISMPVDTSPAGLRKFDKNTALTLSNILCGQVERAKGMTLGDLVMSVLPWPFHKSLPDGNGDAGPCADDHGLQIGMICSLSIPIITICALIILMIMINLFDIIFHWMPYFMLCFPLPKFDAKEFNKVGST